MLAVGRPVHPTVVEVAYWSIVQIPVGVESCDRQ